MIVSEVPYYKQEEWYTCGPACLRMLLKYFGTSASEEDVAKACGTTELGTTPMKLVKGSKVFGFDADAFKYVDMNDLKYTL
jgi:ABC-type bacteriocin/lantibiotic exporter with double-glycine peptidase domain